MTTSPRLRLALLGLGRLGALRARILAFQQPRIELVAVCDTKPGADAWAASNLPASVQFFADPEDCLRRSGAQAVLISTATATHAPLICLALDLDLHVMCEKPISIDLITTAEVVERAKSKPHLKFLLPFTRRYDPSHRAAKQLVDSGALGEIHAVETSCLDMQTDTGFWVAFSEQSGGIFVDSGIHVIDIGRYFLNVTSSHDKRQVKRVIAFGQQAVYTDLARFGDCDNAWGMVEFSNGTILTLHLARTLTNGFESTTRLCGTKGHSVVNGNPAATRVEVRDGYGVRMATTPDAFTLYDTTFINDIAEFADAVLDNGPLTCSPQDAFEAGKIASALQHSFRCNAPVYFDKQGLPILETPAVNGSNGVAPVTNGEVNEFKVLPPAEAAKTNGFNGASEVNGTHGVNGKVLTG